MSSSQPHGMTRRELRERACAASSMDAAHEPARILTVCTGNICRSPMAEGLLRARLAGAPVRVHSAGTRAMIDDPMDATSHELAVELGMTTADADAHRARWLLEPVADDADLILTMAREHRTATVELSPRMLRQTFTIREFARLSQGLTDDEITAEANAAGPAPRARIAAVAALVTRQRGVVPPAPPEDDDVVDPYRRSRATYERSVAQLVPAVDEVARVLRAALA